MARKAKKDWIMAGIDLLASDGAQALTIQALVSRVGVTKGSFYHHFKGIDDFVGQFLIYFEQEGTLNIIETVEREPTAEKRLHRLFEIATSHSPILETAMRAWALQDERVRQVYERVDRQRIAYVAGLCDAIVQDMPKAQRLAQAMYTTLIGSDHIMPPLTAAEKMAIFEDYIDRLATS